MAEHVWSVLCYRASIDQVTNNVSLLHVIERISLPGSEEELLADLGEGEVRGLQTSMELVSLWSRSKLEVPETASARFRFVTPTGLEAENPTLAEIDLAPDFNARVRIRIPAIPFVGFGVYYCIVELQEDDRWEHKARLPLVLQQLKNRIGESEVSEDGPGQP